MSFDFSSPVEEPLFKRMEPKVLIPEVLRILISREVEVLDPSNIRRFKNIVTNYVLKNEVNEFEVKHPIRSFLGRNYEAICIFSACVIFAISIVSLFLVILDPKRIFLAYVSFGISLVLAVFVSKIKKYSGLPDQIILPPWKIISMLEFLEKVSPEEIPITVGCNTAKMGGAAILEVEYHPNSSVAFLLASSPEDPKKKFYIDWFDKPVGL